MVFQGKTAHRLRADEGSKQNGGKDFAKLLDHVEHEGLVLWGWAPGKGRTLPPMSHDKFVAAFKAWIDGGGACP
jgi:hypothetical protein